MEQLNSDKLARQLNDMGRLFCAHAKVSFTTPFVPNTAASPAKAIFPLHTSVTGATRVFVVSFVELLGTIIVPIGQPQKNRLIGGFLLGLHRKDKTYFYHLNSPGTSAGLNQNNFIANKL